MKSLAIAVLMVGFIMVAVTIVKQTAQNKPGLAGDDQSARGQLSEKIAPHTDQEIIDAQCPEEDDSPWKLGKPINCEESPNKKYIAKFFYNGYSDPDRYYELFVVNATNKLVKRIWAGDFRTLGWDWKGDNGIEVRYNCGTGCQAVKVMNPSENASIADYRDGRMNEKNGWKIKFAGSF